MEGFILLFFWVCKLYTRFDQARHDRAIGVRGESFDTNISSPRNNSHLVLNELKVMLSHLEESKSYYLTPSAEDTIKPQQVFGDDYPTEISAPAVFLSSLNDKVSNLISSHQEPNLSE